MNERRKNDRIDAHDVGLVAVNGVDDRELGIIGNLSVGGLMLIASQELYTDGILQIKIDLPAELGAGAVSMGVKVLWCTPANSPQEFWAGLETIDISHADKDALQRLIDHLAGKA